MSAATGEGVPACPYGVCDGSGFVEDENLRTATPCRCRPARIARARARSRANKIPKKYRGLSFERAPICNMPPPTVAIVRRYVRDIGASLDAGRGLWLFGDVGTGKTSLAMLVSACAMEAGRSVAIYSLPRLLAEIIHSFDDSANGSRIALLDHLAEVDLLHIDDVGAQRTSEWVLEQLYTIINARYEEERSIVVTTNLTEEQLREQINERTVSRLEEMCEVLPLFGADARRVTYGAPAGP